MIKKTLTVATEKDAMLARSLCEPAGVEFCGSYSWGKFRTFMAGAPGVSIGVRGNPSAIKRLKKAWSEAGVKPQSVYYILG